MAITSNKYGMEELKTLVSSFSNLVLRDYSNNGYKELLFEDNQYKIFSTITLTTDLKLVLLKILREIQTCSQK